MQSKASLRRFWWCVGVLVPLAAAASCGDSGDGSAGTGGTAGSAGSAGSGGSAGATTGGTGGLTTGNGGSGGGAGGAGGSSSNSGGGGSGGTGGSSVSSSPGCGKTGAATGTAQKRMLQVNGKQRTFVLSVPASYTGKDPLALVFVFHGSGQEGSTQQGYFGLEGPAAGKSLFVYPDGLARSRNGGTASTGWDGSATGDDVALFDAVVKSLGDEYCLNRKHVFATGFSAGGIFVNSLGCARATALRGIAPIAGFPPRGTCAGPLATQIWHGAKDTNIAISNGEQTRDAWGMLDGCQTSSRPAATAPCVSQDGCQAAYPVQWCRHDGGHEVPAAAHEGVWKFFESLF